MLFALLLTMTLSWEMLFLNDIATVHCFTLDIYILSKMFQR